LVSLSRSIFCKSALASGLVTKAELDEALSALVCELEPARRNDPAAVSDERLAKKLIELGRLNAWQAAQLAAGKTKFTLCSYKVLDAIGQGGMGQVFKAEHTIMRRVVAIKVLPRDRATPETVAAFHREIQTLAQLDHENLVRAYDANYDDVHFLVTEYVPGTDLRRHIRRLEKQQNARLTMRAAAAIICQAAKGLDYAHGRGLIHRDIKPGNLLLTVEGQVKVSDLGLAGFFQEADIEADETHSGKIIGTADYLSPEQISAPEKQGPPSDVYALGCTLYYAATGKVPFPGGTTRDKVLKHLKQQPLSPKRLNPELTDEFCDVIFDMMKKDPAERIGTAAEVIQRLSPWAGESWTETAREVSIVASNSSLRLGQVPASLRSSPGDLEDTRPVLDDGQGIPPEESPSQVSQITHPMGSGEEETLWLSELGPRLQDSGFSTGVLVIVLAGLLTAATVLGAMIMRLLGAV
jgi:serine/threonine protein kinase